jgi:hypothetical protein
MLNTIFLCKFMLGGGRRMVLPGGFGNLQLGPRSPRYEIVGGGRVSLPLTNIGNLAQPGRVFCLEACGIVSVIAFLDSANEQPWVGCVHVRGILSGCVPFCLSRNHG